MSPRPGVCREYDPGRVARRIATPAVAVLVGGLLSVTGAQPAVAAPTITTFEQLATAFAAGGTVVLGGDIAGAHNDFLDVDPGESVTLDLAGYDLSITDAPAGVAGIGVPAGSELVVKDSSGGGQVTADGGTGGAGIGGDAGAPGHSQFLESHQAVNGASGASGTVTGGDGIPGGNGTTSEEGGGNGGHGGAVAGTAPLASGGNGAPGGAGGQLASGGDGGNGGASSTTGLGGTAVGGSGGAGGEGGKTAPGGHGGSGGAAVSVSGVGVGGTGGNGGVGGAGEDGATGGGTGVVTVLSGTVVATGGAGAAGIGGGVGGDGDVGANGGNGGAGGAGTGAGGTGVGGPGGLGGTGGAGGNGGDGGAGGTVTIWNNAVAATGGAGAADIGGGVGGVGAAGGAGGANGANGASSRVAPGGTGATGNDGNAGASGTVTYLPAAGLPAKNLAVTAPTGLQLAGTSARITARGLAAGESYTIRIGTTQVATGTAAGGLVDRRVTLPPSARDSHAPVVVTGSETDRTGSAATWILVKKRLGISFDKHVRFKQRQHVTVTGLVGQERVSLRYRGKLVSPASAHATNGVYRFSFRVGRLRGVKKMRATGQFAVRTVVTTFKVSKR